MSMTKKYVGDMFLHVSYIPIGHQHHNMPECDVGDVCSAVLSPTSLTCHQHIKICHQYRYSPFEPKLLLTTILPFRVWKFKNLEQERLKGFDIIFS